MRSVLSIQHVIGAQFHQMKENERTSLFIDYQHMMQHDADLADAVKESFHFLEPHLRQSVSKVMAGLHEQYSQDREFHVSFFNLPHINALRELRTDKIAQLIRCDPHFGSPRAAVWPHHGHARHHATRMRPWAICAWPPGVDPNLSLLLP
jgi:hypothetical protein